MGKTILQIANEIGVSKQAVYKRFKGKLHTEVLPYAHTKDGVTYIMEHGENIIKQDFLGEAHISDESHTERIQNIIEDTVKDMLTDMLIQLLQKEIEKKNKQIEDLTATVKIQAESINAMHKNELAETIIDGQTSVPKLGVKNKKSIFNKLFFKKNN